MDVEEPVATRPMAMRFGRRRSSVAPKLGRRSSRASIDQGSDPDAWRLVWHKLTKDGRMRKLVETKAESRRFAEDYKKKKQQEYQEKELRPIFNKRLFTATGNVVITADAKRIMGLNAFMVSSPTIRDINAHDMAVMRNVVGGLKLIHKGHDYVKDALSHVVSVETFDDHQYITKEKHEQNLSCYYIVYGAVEVTYDVTLSAAKSFYQPNIVYRHGTGEYIGLVSLEGFREDLSSPATMYTKEISVLLRIDRNKFHKVVAKYALAFDKAKREFMSLPNCVLSQMPEEAKTKILDKIHRLDVPANRTIIGQGDLTDYMFFLVSGRVLLYKDIYIREAERDSKFLVTICNPGNHITGSFFAEECVLENSNSVCTAVSTTRSVIYKISRIAFELVEPLNNVVKSNRNEYPEAQLLMDRGYSSFKWGDFKHNVVKEALTEMGSAGRCLLPGMNLRKKVITRPLTASERYNVDMDRFLTNNPLYTQSCSKTDARVRPQTVHNIRQSVRPSVSCTDSATNVLKSTDSSRRSSIEASKDLSNRSAVVKSKEASQHSAVVKPPWKRLTPGSAKLTLLSALTQKQKLVKDRLSDTLNIDELAELMKESPAKRAEVIGQLITKHVGKRLPKEKLEEILRQGDCTDLLKIFDETSDLGRQLQLSDMDDGFTKTTVMMTMTTEEIVRKAKEEIATKRARNNQDEDEGNWFATLQEEHANAKTMSINDKLQVMRLYKRLIVLRSTRDKGKNQYLDTRKYTSGIDLDKLLFQEELNYLDQMDSVEDILVEPQKYESMYQTGQTQELKKFLKNIKRSASAPSSLKMGLRPVARTVTVSPPESVNDDQTTTISEP